MARVPYVYSEISKFKRVEASLRSACNRIQVVVEDIDKVKEGRCSRQDRAVLDSFRKECVELHQRSKETLDRLWDEVEGSEQK